MIRTFLSSLVLLSLVSCQTSKPAALSSEEEATLASVAEACLVEVDAPAGAPLERTLIQYSSRKVVKYTLAKHEGVNDQMRHHFEECYRNNKPK